MPEYPTDKLPIERKAAPRADLVFRRQENARVAPRQEDVDDARWRALEDKIIDELPDVEMSAIGEFVTRQNLFDMNGLLLAIVRKLVRRGLKMETDRLHAEIVRSHAIDDLQLALRHRK